MKRVSAARAAAEVRAVDTLAIPLGGVSMLDKPEQPFWDRSAIEAFRDGFVASADPSIEVIETEDNINDPAFADLLLATIQSALSG